MPRLIIKPGLPDQQVAELGPGVTSIGRTTENHVSVTDKSLSRRHAQIEIVRGIVTLVDVGSKNGTFVGTQRIDRLVLRPGATFRCGDIAFRLESDDDRPPDRPAAPMLTCALRTQFDSRSLGELLVNRKASQPPPAAETNPRIALEPETTDAAPGPVDRTKEKLAILLQASQLLAAPLDLDALLERILDLAFEIFKVDRAAILMVDEQSGALGPRVTKSRSGENPGQIYSQHIVDYVRANTLAALFADAQIDPRLAEVQSIFTQSIRASMCAPLKPPLGAPASTKASAEAEVVGVLYVDNRSVVNRYDAEDLELLTAFANQAAAAIENTRLRRRIEEEAVSRARLARFFPPNTLDRLGGATLDRIDTEVTALFGDISGYTEMSSTMPPRAVMELLDQYLPRMADVVFQFDGTIEKYIGDALLAVWGAPFPHTDDADRALGAAVQMQRAIAELSAGRLARGVSPIAIHIGLNTGVVTAGPIGSERYLQYATIGDPTNVASRVCGVARAGEVVISEATRSRLRDAWPLADLGPVPIKGKEEPVRLYRVEWRTSPP